MIPTTLTTEKNFIGQNVYTDAPLLSPGFCQLLDNLFVDGGVLAQRPGKQGTTTLADINARGGSGNGNYGLFPVVTMNTTVSPPTYQTWMIYANGGKVYQQQKGATTSTEILIGGATSFNLVSANVYFERVGRFIYVIDGNATNSPTNGGTPVYRISFDASGTPTTAAYVGQTAPTSAPVATLTAGNIDTPTAANWTAAPQIAATTAFVITAATNATPIAITVTGTHGYATNDIVTIAGAQGNTAANGTWIITVTGASTFTLNSVAGNGAWTAGGTATKGGYSNMLANGSFTVHGGTSGNVFLPGTPWGLVNGPYSLSTNSTDYGPGSSGGASQVSFGATTPFSLLLDNPANAVGQSVTPPPLTKLAAPSAYGLSKAFCFQFTAQAQRQSAGSKAKVALVVTAHDSGGNALAVMGPILLNPPSAAMAGTVSATLNFGPALATLGDPDHYDIVLASGPDNQGGNGVWIGVCTFTPIQNGPIITDAASNQVQWAALFPPVGGTYIVRDFGQAGKDLSNAGHISLPASTPLATDGIKLRVGLVGVNTTTRTLTAATNASPIACTTSANHGYATGDVVVITGALGNTAANGTWTIVVTGATTFTLTGSTGSGAWTSGGTVVSYTHQTINWTNPLDFATDGTSLSVDITTVAPAILASVRFLYVFFVADLPPATNVSNILTFGPITSGGKLSVADPATGAAAGPYSGVFTEVNGRATTITAASNASPIAITTSAAHAYQSGDQVFIYDVLGNTAANGTWFIVVTGNTTFTLVGSTGNGAWTSGGTCLELSDVIEGDPSPISAQLQATEAKASIQYVFPAAVNANTNYFFYYRLGGVLSGGYRLVAILPLGTDSLPSTSPATSVQATWTHSTRTLVDNVPDGTLQSSAAVSLVTGRGLPPAGAQAHAAWQGRYWMAKGSTLYGSWLVSERNPSALYFNSINPGGDDPNEAIKGIQEPVGGSDNDPIQRIVPLDTALIILKSRSVWVLRGFDANDFTLTQYLSDEQVGCVAPRAVAKVGNKLWFLAQDGIAEFDGDVHVNVSTAIERLLCPAQSNGTPLTQAAFAKCAMLWAGRRLYLLAPQAGDSANTCAWVWDQRQNGWYRYLQMNISGGCALAGGADNAEIYLAGLDGQNYQLTGSGDKLYSNSAATAISWAVNSRGIGQEDGGAGYWRENIPTYLYTLVTTAEDVNVTLSLNVAGCLAGTYTRLFDVNTQRLSIRVDVPSDQRGDYMTVGLSGSSITPTRISALGIEYAQGKPPNS